ncbi:hypothetical protein ACU4GA_16940 [Methylobacterium oryzae CBMB20]
MSAPSRTSAKLKADRRQGVPEPLLVEGFPMLQDDDHRQAVQSRQAGKDVLQRSGAHGRRAQGHEDFCLRRARFDLGHAGSP